MRRRTLFKRAVGLALPLVPTIWTRSRDSEPEPALSYEYIYIGDVPDGATVSSLAEHEHELDDSALGNLESSAEQIHEPGDYTAVGRLLGPSSIDSDGDLPPEPSPIDYTALEYSRPDNAPDGYYVDVGEKVVLITSIEQSKQYPEFTE